MNCFTHPLFPQSISGIGICDSINRGFCRIEEVENAPLPPLPEPPPRTFTWLKTLCSRVISFCNQIARLIFWLLFRSSDRVSRERSSNLERLISRSIVLINAQIDSFDSLPVQLKIQISSRRLTSICSSVIIDCLRPKDWLMPLALNRPFDSNIDRYRANLPKLSLFLDRSLTHLTVLSDPIASPAKWLAIYQSLVQKKERNLRSHLADLAALFADGLPFKDGDLVILLKLFNTILTRREVWDLILHSNERNRRNELFESASELTDERNQLIGPLQSSLKLQIEIFESNLKHNDSRLLRDTLDSMRAFSASTGPVWDEILLKSLQTVLSSSLKWLWIGPGSSAGEDQNIPSISAVLKANLGITNSIQTLLLCKLFALDGLCTIATSSPIAGSMGRSTHDQLFVQPIAQLYRNFLNQLLTRYWILATSPGVLKKKIQSAAEGDFSGAIEIPVDEYIAVAPLFFFHYLHRIARSELSVNISGGGKFNALLLWQLERFIVDPLARGQSQLAWALWGLHSCWPLVCFVAACSPIDWTHRPRQALCTMATRGFRSIRQRSDELYREVDTRLVNCFDALTSDYAKQFGLLATLKRTLLTPSKEQRWAIWLNRRANYDLMNNEHRRKYTNCRSWIMQ